MNRRKKIILSVLGILVIGTSFLNMANLNLTKNGTNMSYSKHKKDRAYLTTPEAGRCTAKTKLVFLKVHKTGSSTMANIVQRFGLKKHLKFALPNKKLGDVRYNYFGGIGGTLRREEILNSTMETNETFSLLYNHVIYDKPSFERIFDNETKYVTIVREPFSQFTSALLFFLNEKLYKIATTNLTQYLNDPDLFEPSNRYLSFTDNRQALDLGVPVHKVRHRRFINNYIKILDSSFHLVMITEFFDESLILLKRLMCWSFADILYMRKNTAYRKFRFQPTEADMENYRDWAMADNAIYRHFYEKFMDTVSLQVDFEEEVAEFKRVLKETQSFCKSRSYSGRSIHFNHLQWSKAFTVNSLDCFYMKCHELQLQNMLSHHFQ